MLLGTNYHKDVDVCGLPCSQWVQLVLESYVLGGEGVVSFNGYPDGQPLLEQEHTALAIFKIVLAEIVRAQYGKRR